VPLPLDVPKVLQVVRDVALELSEALAPALFVLCPDAVIISGGVARAGAVLREAMQAGWTS
jgi:predicted NBD/HSP70 family sugar kinase